MNLLKKVTQVSNIIAVLMVLLLLASCNDFITREPKSSAGANSFFRSSSDFEQAVNATYGALQSLIDPKFTLWTDVRADNCTNVTVGGPTTGDIRIDRFFDLSTNSDLENYYRQSYNGIARANRILANIDDADIAEADKSQYKGEAEVLRAYFYFNLVRFFGEIQLVTDPGTDVSTQLVSADRVYEVIIEDLTSAAELLPLSYSGNDVGRVTKGTAQSLLGTVNLTRKNYEDAATEFQKVVDSNEYGLLNEYSVLFDEGQQGNQESVWQVLYRTGNNEGSSFVHYFVPNQITGSQNVLVAGSAFGGSLPTKDIQDAYDSGDVRKDAIANGFTDVDGNFVPAKYVKYYVERDDGDSNLGESLDWYIIRYADVLLRYAEALNEVNDRPTPAAYEAINNVRQRAGLPDLNNSLSYEDFKEAVYKEERLESPFEGHRWFDLLRTDRALEVMNSKVATDSTTVGIAEPIQEDDLLYPIPQRVREISLEQ